MTFVIVSFNVDCDNRDPERIKRLVAFQKPDIICLQEVPEELRQHLEINLSNEYPHQSSAVDHFSNGLLGLHTQKRSYLMILSRVPFLGEIRHTHKSTGKRTLLARVRGWQECVEHQGVDVEIHGTLFRIINLHVACAETEKNKLRQFRRAVRHHLEHDGLTIICGDFNVTTTPLVRHLPAYLLRRIYSRYSIQEMIQQRELKIFARIVEKKGLCDVSGDGVTHPDSGLSLDKILVSREIHHASEAVVCPHQFGSDHLPQAIRLNLTRP